MADREAAGQRLDKWLWFARLARTRSLAAKLVASGYVRVNSRRVTTPAKAIAPGDVLTVALHRQVRVLRVASMGTRRGKPAEASHLFDDLE